MTTKDAVFFSLAILGAAACATDGSHAGRALPAAVSSATPDPPDPAPCGGNDIDLPAVLANRRCRPSRDAPAAPASAASDLKVTLRASTSSVSPGGHVDLTLEILNAGAASIPLFFSGDLTLGVEVRDDKGARLSPPAGNAPKNADPRCAQVDCRLPESHVVLAPGARAHATLGWEATMTAWPASGPTTCCTYHVDPVPGGPLSDGVYRVKVPLPYESDKGNPADSGDLDPRGQMTMQRAARFGILALLTVTSDASGQSAPAVPVFPPPSAFLHPGFVYYNGPQPLPRTIPMPPALSLINPMNLAHLKTAGTQPSRCNVPKEVADGVFVHIDCIPYRRVSVAVKHATSLKQALMRLGRLQWQPAPAAGTMRGTAPTGAASGAARASAGAQPPLPDLVDHRLNGTEGPIKDQGDVGACTAFALSSVMDNSLRRANQNVTTSPEHVWGHYATPTMEDAASGNLNKEITTFAALPYSGRDACELTHDTTDDCGQTYGVLPNTAPADPALEQRLRTADQANGHRAIAFEELEVSPPNVDEIVATIASGADVWCGLNIDSSVWVNRRMQSFVIPDWSQPDGGHAVALAGYRRVNGGLQFLVHNSWGASWGDGGYAWISQAMIQQWLQGAYKVRTDVDAGSPSSPLPPATDEDCPGDQVIDTVTNKCAGVCPDQSRPANGQCPTGPAPAPQPVVLPSLPSWATLPGIPAIPGWPIPSAPPPATPAPPGQPLAPTSPTTTPWTIPSAWPWPVPSGLPPWPPPTK